jgi:ketosteroid isomerase-like protein
MTFLDRFFYYAADFERTYVDDDWSRLEKHFTDDAVYEVKNVPFACRLAGRTALFKGIRKSLDGFDRRFTVRKVEVTAPPELRSDGVVVNWKGTYEKEGLDSVTIRGRSEARYRDDRIEYLSDTYDDGVGAETMNWARRHPTFDPSYT